MMRYKDCHIIHTIIASAASDKGMSLSRQMVKQLYAELRAMGTFDDVAYSPDEPTMEHVSMGMLEEPADPVGVSVYTTLEALVAKNVDKPLSAWQRNQLERWDKQLHSNPPENVLLLEIPVSQEIQEKRHQIERIRNVCAATTNAANHLYDKGVRIIEQE